MHLIKDEIVDVNGRELAYKVSGDIEGEPAFLLHGTPGSREGPHPRGVVLYNLGIRLITYDRPGYGDSERNEGRRVVDCVEDVQAIARALKISRFAVLGRSGGSPHALACAAKMPDKVTKAVSLVGIAPKYMTNINWLDGMNAQNRDAFSKRKAEAIVDAKYRAARIKRNPQVVLDDIDGTLRATDRDITEYSPIRRLLINSYKSAVKNGHWGLADDIIALTQSYWGFDVAEISVPTIFWHGEDDSFSPARHSAEISRRILGSKAIVAPGSHFTSYDATTAMLIEATHD